MLVFWFVLIFIIIYLGNNIKINQNFKNDLLVIRVNKKYPYDYESFIYADAYC